MLPIYTWHSMLSCVAVSRAMASSSWARTVTSVWEMRSSRLRKSVKEVLRMRH